MSNGSNDPPSWVTSLWNITQQFFVSMFKSVWAGFTELVPNVTRTAWKETREFWGVPEDEQWQNMLDMFINTGMLSDDTAAEIKKLKDLATPLDFIAYHVIFYSMHMEYVKTTLYASTADLRHALNSRYSPEIPFPESLLQAAFVAPELTEHVRDGLKKHGFSDEDIDTLFISKYRLYSEDTIRQLYLRGVLTVDQMFMRMRELGYTDTRIKEISQSWDIIPVPMDILHLVGKEAFEPDSIEKMGLLDEFPMEQIDWLKKQGFSEYWAQKFWIAHWDQPSIQQGFEMLHRGQIDLDDLDMLFRTVEIPPYWREKLTAIAYMPYTRVDVRRMHDLGVLSNKELLRAYLDLGYDEEHAINMAKFTILYNQGTNKDLSKTEILTGFKEKVLDKDVASTLLQQLGYSIDEADYILTLEDYKESKSNQNLIIKNIGERYKNRLIDQSEARNRLNQLGLAQIRVDSLMDQWEIDLYEDMKLPSKTDLEKLLLNGIITDQQYTYQMNLLGYGYQYIDWYLQLAKGKQKE